MYLFILTLHIPVICIKENIITKLQKLYSLHRNLKVGNKQPTLFLKKPLCTCNLLPASKIFIERPKACKQYLVYFKKQYPVFLTKLTFLKIIRIQEKPACSSFLLFKNISKTTNIFKNCNHSLSYTKYNQSYTKNQKHMIMTT